MTCTCEQALTVKQYGRTFITVAWFSSWFENKLWFEQNCLLHLEDIGTILRHSEQAVKAFNLHRCHKMLCEACATQAVNSYRHAAALPAPHCLEVAKLAKGQVTSHWYCRESGNWGKEFLGEGVEVGWDWRWVSLPILTSVPHGPTGSLLSLCRLNKPFLRATGHGSSALLAPSRYCPCLLQPCVVLKACPTL